MRNRVLLLAIAVVATSGMLAGCSLLNPGPPRGADGQVTKATKISAQDLKTNDCFSFNSADGSVVSEVTVKPCTEKHDYIVIAEGTLTQAEIATSSSLQDAISAACSGPFEKFKSGVKSETRPEQQFMAFPDSDKPDANQSFYCLTTDPDQSANSTPTVSTPEPTVAPTP